MNELTPGAFIQNYEIIRSLGKGGMAQVYLAKDSSGKLYAIKELSKFTSFEQQSVAFKSFSREVDMLSHIKHPGLPKFYKRFEYKDRIYLVMEYIEGETLEQIISLSPSPVEEKKVLTWGIQLCEILFYLHTLSPGPVIYRDMKPGNVIITNEGNVRLIDFGIARRYDPLKNKDTIRLGTPGYAAPEQCRENQQTTPRTDIYSLGVLLHQLLTKYDPTLVPFKLPSVRSLKPSVPEQLEWVISKATSLNPGDRYVDMDIFREELLDCYKEKFGRFSSSYERFSPVSIINHEEIRQRKTSPESLTIFIVVVCAVSFLALVAGMIFISMIKPMFTNTKDAAIWYRKGCELSEEGKYEEAVQCYDKALKINPRYTDVWIREGVDLDKEDKLEKAIECYDKALGIDPKNVLAWYDKGVSLGKEGDDEEAVRCYDKALEINPEYVSALYNKGCCLQSLGKYEDAIKCYDKALEIDPGNENIRIRKSQVLGSLGKNDELLRSFDRLLEINPKNAMMWYNKGVTLGKMGRAEEAIQCYDKALNIEPKYYAALHNKGWEEQAIKKYEDALKCYDRALELEPANASTWTDRGLAFSGLGKLEKAIECYDKALKCDPGFSQARIQKEEALKSLGK